MRIENLYSITHEGKARVGATVIWEDSERPSREIFFETDERFSDRLTSNPHSFLIACLLPAVRHKEERIYLDEEICPELRNGLLTIMDLNRHWFDEQRKPVRIEAKIQSQPKRSLEKQAGSFLSGGVDSLATLRTNRLDFPLEHPLSIKECLLVHGFDIGGYEAKGKQTVSFEQAEAALSRVAQDAGVGLIPVYTNIKHLDDNLQFWIYEFYGAALASVAHAFSSRFGTVSIASPRDIFHIMPSGSNPLLDPNFSSFDLRIRHDGVRFSRLERVRIISEWDAALQNLRVCTINIPGHLNCGSCEKCLRTMTALLIVGKLNRTDAFPIKEVPRELFAHIGLNESTIPFYQEFIQPLAEIGRYDLVEVIREKIAIAEKYIAWKNEKDWKGIIKRIDRKYFGGTLIKFREMVR